MLRYEGELQGFRPTLARYQRRMNRDGGGGTLADDHGWDRYERLWLKALIAYVQAKMVTDGGAWTTGSQLRQDRVQFR